MNVKTHNKSNTSDGNKIQNKLLDAYIISLLSCEYLYIINIQCLYQEGIHLQLLQEQKQYKKNEALLYFKM